MVILTTAKGMHLMKIPGRWPGAEPKEAARGKTWAGRCGQEEVLGLVWLPVGRQRLGLLERPPDGNQDLGSFTLFYV